MSRWIMDFMHSTSILEKNICVPKMEKFERRMLDNGSCTIKGGKEKRFQNEINNMVQGIKRSLDEEII
jgi:hypothetical protein